MICRGCRSVKNQGTKGVDHAMTLLEGLPAESGLQRSFQYCWWSPKVADGASWWLTASTPSHWWHCSFHILHPITLSPALDAEMCHFLFSNCIPHLQWVLVHFLDKTVPHMIQLPLDFNQLCSYYNNNVWGILRNSKTLENQRPKTSFLGKHGGWSESEEHCWGT